jgi:hypothetical protein
MEIENSNDTKNYGKMGCFVAIFLFILVIILIATGVVNFPWEY